MQLNNKPENWTPTEIANPVDASLDAAGNALPGQGVYLDSPVLSAIRQILPFYRAGVFSTKDTPLLLRVKPAIRAQLATTPLPADLDVRKLSGREVGQLPVADRGVVFYPYNSQSNMNAVTNRKAHHVLTLHGESNKLASNRPAARLYDYICIAGQLGRDRYLNARIFTPTDTDRGRLIMMGDSFVQTIPWIHNAQAGEDGAALYCPTWEGYGNGLDNYSSITGGRGFEIAVQAAKAAEIDTIIVKPHPYLGLLQPRLLRDFIVGVRMMVAEGLNVKLALADASKPVRMLHRLSLSSIPLMDESGQHTVAIRLGLCDVSGVEAMFLKQRVHHMVITTPELVPQSLRGFYYHKAIFPQTDVAQSVRRYMGQADDVDTQHRKSIFGWHTPELEQMTPDLRRNWLINYVRRDPFWQR